MPDDSSSGADRRGDRRALPDVRAGAAEAQSFVRHELRTPLAVLQPVLDMLLDGTAGELELRQRDYLAMLERNVRRLGGMITSLVETGWLEVASVPPNEERVELAPLLRDLAKALVAQVDAAPRIEVREREAGAAADASSAVLGDSYRLSLALRNVLVNSCIYTPASGSVLVTLAESGDRAVVEVSDTGCGIPENELAHVFELGFQGSAAQERLDRGLGLGLPVARALLESMGGSIRVESEAGKGTTVVVELPAAD